MGGDAQEAPELAWPRREPLRRTCRTWRSARAAGPIDSDESRASPGESSAALLNAAQTISVQVDQSAVLLEPSRGELGPSSIDPRVAA